jgi:glycosyltransferase involved in cell wall biosynthesis
MDQPLVSIIIPVYNSEKHLAETISSALEQTWPNKEIIIVDDGSADNSLAIAKSFASENVKVFYQPNKGASAARNKGIKEAKGDYIQFLDADDLLMPNKIATQVKQLAGKQGTLSRCPVVHFNEQDTDISNLAPRGDELALYEDSNDPFNFLLDLYDPATNMGAIVPIHSWLSPAALIKKAKWDEDLTVNDDGEYFCRVVLSAKGIMAENNTLCYYRKYIDKSVPSLSGGLDEKSLESLYSSLLLKREHLIKFKKDERVDKVIAINLMILLMRAYPEFKELSKTISESIRKLGGTTYVPILGGKLIEFIKSIFGWKTARRLQFYFYKTT